MGDVPKLERIEIATPNANKINPSINRKNRGINCIGISNRMKDKENSV